MMAVHALAVGLIALTLAGAIRWITRQSAWPGRIVLAGAVIRAVSGLILFAISYFSLPFARSLQLGGGFWTLMRDAVGYFDTASRAVAEGLATIPPASPSPFFTATLAVWMHIVGVGPLAGTFLNLCAYAAICTLLTYLFRPTGRSRDDRPLIVALAALSFSPALLMGATQTLKDDLFLALIVLICVVIRTLFRAIDGRASLLLLLPALVVLGVATYGASGIRAYYAVIVSASVGVAIAGLLVRGPGRVRLNALAFGVLALAIIWFAYWRGAGPYFRPTAEERQMLVRSLDHDDGVSPLGAVLRAAAEAVDSARAMFVRAGGATNISGTPLPAASDGATSEQDPSPQTAPAPASSEDKAPAAAAPGGDSASASAAAAAAAGGGVGQDTAGAQAAAIESESAGLQVSAVETASRLELVAIGVAAIVVPITLLKAASIVSFSGGRGLLPIADADTLFIDVALLALFALVVSGRQRLRSEGAFVLFALALSVITALLLGYVVTNFGTLFRMRYLVTVPIWLLALALSPQSGGDERFVDTRRFGVDPYARGRR